MWRKNFRIRKVQTFMLFVILMLCTTLLNASICILTTLDQPYQELLKECNSADAILYPYIREDASIETVKKELMDLKEIDDVEAVQFHYVTEEVQCNGKSLECFVNLTLYNEKVFGSARTQSGSMDEIATLDKNECYLPICIANEAEIQVGDTIDIAFSTGVESYRVAGLFVEPYSTSTAFDSYMLVNELPEQIAKSENLFLYLKDGKTTLDVEDDYRECHDGKMPGEMKSVEDIISNGLVAGNIVGAVFLAIGVIMMVVSALIINFMVRNAMHQDEKNIAVYKTMGYTQSTIQNMYLMFYFVITLIGCIAGVTASQFVSGLILKGIYSNIGAITSVNPFISGIPCIIITCVFVTGVVKLIVNRTKRVKPVYVLNGMEQGNTKKKKYHGNSSFQFSPLGIALRSITRDKKGIIGVLITTITTVFSINFAMMSLDIARDMKNQNDYWLGIDRSDVVVTASSGEDISGIKTMLQEDGEIEYVTNDCLGDSVVMLSWKKGQTVNTMYAFVYEDFGKIELPVIEGRNPSQSNEIAISTKVADQLNKHVGDYIEVYLGGEVKANLMISGLFQTYYSLGKSCRLLRSTYVEHNYEQNFMNFSIYLKENVDKEDYINELSKRIGNRGVVTRRTEMFPSIMNMIATPQVNAIPALMALVCIIGGVNIFSIILLKNREAEKRNSIYKTIGYNTAHLVKANLIYVLILAVISCVVALPLNLLTYSSIMKLALSMFGFRSYPTIFSPLHLLLCNLMILIVFVFCTFLSSRSLRKVNVRNLVCE